MPTTGATAPRKTSRKPAPDAAAQGDLPLVFFKCMSDAFEDDLKKEAAEISDADTAWIVIEAYHTDSLMKPREVRGDQQVCACEDGPKWTKSRLDGYDGSSW